MDVALEARIEKISKNIEFLILKRNIVLKYNIYIREFLAMNQYQTFSVDDKNLESLKFVVSKKT